MDVPAPEVKVLLPEEYTRALKQQLEDTLNEAVESVRHDAYLATPFVAGKRNAAKFLGIGTSTLDTLIANGLPYKLLPEVNKYIFNKADVTRWVNNL